MRSVSALGADELAGYSSADRCVAAPSARCRCAICTEVSLRRQVLASRSVSPCPALIRSLSAAERCSKAHGVLQTTGLPGPAACRCRRSAAQSPRLFQLRSRREHTVFAGAWRREGGEGGSEAHRTPYLSGTKASWGCGQESKESVSRNAVASCDIQLGGRPIQRRCVT